MPPDSTLSTDDFEIAYESSPMSYSSFVPFSRTWSAQILRPFFKWMTSPCAHTVVPVKKARLARNKVTEDRTQAHSSNRKRVDRSDRGNQKTGSPGLPYPCSVRRKLRDWSGSSFRPIAPFARAELDTHSPCRTALPPTSSYRA